MTTTPMIHLGAATEVGPLTVFPVWTDAPRAARALRTSLPQGTKVGELESGSSVERLSLHHPGPKAFLLPGGTIFGGGWQHRALVHGVVVEQPVDLDLDVRCVEQLRWNGDGAQRVHQRRAPIGVQGALRGIRSDRRDRVDQGDRDDQARYESGLTPHPTRSERADQGEVWRRVQSYSPVLGMSASLSLVEITDVLDDGLDDLLGQVQLLDGQRGVLIGVAGHPAVLEVFDHPRTLAGQIRAILGGVLADAAMVPTCSTPGYRARAFAHRVSRRDLSPVSRAGTGVLAETRDDLAAIDGVTTGDDRLVHLSALNVRHDLVAAA